MAKIYNKIVESTTEPSKEDLWLKEGKIKKFKNGWEDISGKSDVKIPTKVSELENDSEFVRNSSLGTAAYKNVEDLQGGNMTLVNEVSGEVNSKTYIYTSNSNSGNKIFVLDYTVVNYSTVGSLLDSDGNRIGTFTNDTTVTQEQIGVDLFKIICYMKANNPNIYISNRPISYICLGEYTSVMPTAVAGDVDKVTYSIKEYA